MKLISLLFSLVISTACMATEQNTLDKMDKVLSDFSRSPMQLRAFLQEFPKGGELHNHLWGAVKVDKMTQHALKHSDPEKIICINLEDMSSKATKGLTCPEGSRSLQEVVNSPELYNKLYSTWTMKGGAFNPKKPHESTDHFFKIFDLNPDVFVPHRTENLIDIVRQAQKEHLHYLELIVIFDVPEAIELGSKLDWSNNYYNDYNQLKQLGLNQYASNMVEKITKMHEGMRQALKCDTNQAEAACQVEVRYQQAAVRVLPEPLVFAQLALAFEASKQSPLVAGINIVAEEGNETAVKDYDDQMNMINFLDKTYNGLSHNKQVHISLHAGELTPGLVSNLGEKQHIIKALVAGSERIGHGVDISEESHTQEGQYTPEIFDFMAYNKIPVEINLTSNEELLGVLIHNHPFVKYLMHGVPVVLSTDDAGIMMTDLSNEYEKAYNFLYLHPGRYAILKDISRNGITYGFLEGQSLWLDQMTSTPVPACQNQPLGDSNPSSTCQAFLSTSKKATMQWKLEKSFNEFEKRYLN